MDLPELLWWLEWVPANTFRAMWSRVQPWAGSLATMFTAGGTTASWISQRSHRRFSTTSASVLRYSSDPIALAAAFHRHSASIYGFRIGSATGLRTPSLRISRLAPGHPTLSAGAKITSLPGSDINH